MITLTIENNSDIIIGSYRYALIFGVAYALVLPLCAIRSPRVFAQIQPFSVAAAIFYTISLIVYGSKNPICSNDGISFKNNIIMFRTDKSAGELFIDCCRYFPTILFSINITVSVPLVYRDLKGSNLLKRFSLRKSLVIGTLIVFIMFVASGLSSAAFG